jgi:hypothetical protein
MLASLTSAQLQEFGQIAFRTGVSLVASKFAKIDFVELESSEHGIGMRNLR